MRVLKRAGMSVGPRGELTIKTLAMPGSANVYGDVFGGWLVSQMDIGSSTLAHHWAQHRVATVGIQRLSFRQPVKVGHCVSVYASVIKTGRTSITLQVELWLEKRTGAGLELAADGEFTFVALDESGKAVSPVWGAAVSDRLRGV